MSNLEESTPIRPNSLVFLNGLEDVCQYSDEENEILDIEDGKIDGDSNKRKGVALENMNNKRRTTSKYWDHFTKITVDGKLKAKCNHCAKFLSCMSEKGSSHLNRHMKNCFTKKQLRFENTVQKTLNVIKQEDETASIELRSFDVNIVRQKIMSLVIKHELPLKFVEYDAFIELMSYCNPLVKKMSRNTLKTEIFELYKSEKLKILNLLNINDSRVAITTDMWNAINQKRRYMVVTGHFIDNSWRLQSRILRFIYVPAPHTAECLSQVLVKCMMDCNVDRKLSTVTLDNCSTNDAMVERLKGMLSTESLVLGGKFFHMRCAAHILNLIVNDGLAVIEGGIAKIRKSVAYWSSTPKRIETLMMFARQSLIKTERKLVLDCPTRWNSTLVMLDIAVKYKKVFPRVQQIDPHYKCLPSDAEWEMVEKMLEHLRPFYLLTEMFSGTNYPTTNMFFPLACKMRMSLMEWQMSPIIQVKQMASIMIAKFEKYWQEIHGVLVMAVILDPRFKMLLIEYYFPKIYGVGVARKIMKARELSEEIVKYYEAKSIVSGESSTSVVHSHNIVTADSSSFLDLSDFDCFATQTNHMTRSKSDLERYLEEPLVARTSDFDILNWWKANKGKYPILAEIAKDIFAIPITTVASESAFSTGGRQLSPHRAKLHPDTLEAIMCTQNWLWASERGIIPEQLIFAGDELMGEVEEVFEPQQLD